MVLAKSELNDYSHANMAFNPDPSCNLAITRLITRSKLHYIVHQLIA